jgi:hypothetical protein
MPSSARPPQHTHQAGFFSTVRRFFVGDQVKRAHVADHGAFMRSLGRSWAVPMTLVFSTGALVSLGQRQIAQIITALAHHQAPNYVTVALLAITFVIVGGMDLTLLNSAIELRDARLRNVDPKTDPYTRGANVRVWLVSFIESATFMSVAYQLDSPPSFSHDLMGALVAWAFIVMRALAAPVCAIYLATLGKRVVVRRDMYGNLMLTIGGTIEQIIEQLQFNADMRLIRPLWEMQRLVDRASRAKSDDEMDQVDQELLDSLTQLYQLRDQLAAEEASGTPRQILAAGQVVEADDDAETDDQEGAPAVPFYPPTLPERLNRRKAVARMGEQLEAQTRA